MELQEIEYNFQEEECHQEKVKGVLKRLDEKDKQRKKKQQIYLSDNLSVVLPYYGRTTDKKLEKFFRNNLNLFMTVLDASRSYVK
jgi:hypothetical protein